MARTSFLFDADDHARPVPVMAKYSCSQIQAVRLGLILLDENPVLRVRLPPRRKPGHKTQAPDGPHKA